MDHKYRYVISPWHYHCFLSFRYFSLYVFVHVCAYVCTRVCLCVGVCVEAGGQPVRMALSFHNLTAGDLTNIVRHGSEYSTSWTLPPTPLTLILNVIIIMFLNLLNSSLHCPKWQYHFSKLNSSSRKWVNTVWPQDSLHYFASCLLFLTQYWREITHIMCLWSYAMYYQCSLNINLLHL